MTVESDISRKMFPVFSCFHHYTCPACSDYFHLMKIEHSKIYGPLWKSKYGPLVIVNVARADLIEQVLRQEGRHPIRTDMPHWRGYRDLRNQAYGPLTGSEFHISHIHIQWYEELSLKSTIIYLFALLVCRLGAEWQRIRSILNPRMLKPKHVSGYTKAINEVVRDFIEKVAWLKATKGNGVTVHDLAGELYKFAFEGKTMFTDRIYKIQTDGWHITGKTPVGEICWH